MSGKTKIVLNSPGIRSLLRSGEMKDLVGQHAAQIATNAGSGYEFDTYTGPGRVNASVYCADAKAERDNLENNTLLKSMR